MSHDAKLEFIDSQASFSLDNPDTYNYLYFPLANAAGMMSSITPSLGGDIKTDQNTFLLAPVSAEDLHTSRSTRNFGYTKAVPELGLQPVLVHSKFHAATPERKVQSLKRVSFGTGFHGKI